MMKLCIWCAQEFQTPNNGHTQGRYGTCPACEEAKIAQSYSDLLHAGQAAIELAAVRASKDPRR